MHVGVPHIGFLPLLAQVPLFECPGDSLSRFGGAVCGREGQLEVADGDVEFGLTGQPDIKEDVEIGIVLGKGSGVSVADDEEDFGFLMSSVSLVYGIAGSRSGLLSFF